jgi:hypothetical protein
MSPLARLAATLMTLVTLIGAFMLGLVFLAVMLGLGLLLGVAAWLRVWWLRRKLRPEEAAAHETRETIEAEYTVVATERRQRGSGRSDGP